MKETDSNKKKLEDKNKNCKAQNRTLRHWTFWSGVKNDSLDQRHCTWVRSDGIVCNCLCVISEYKYVWDECYVLFFFIKGRGCRFQSVVFYKNVKL